MKNEYGYDPELDYSTKIAEAERNGDWQAARQFEYTRNQKIDDFGLAYGKTYKYNVAPGTGKAAEETAPLASRYAAFDTGLFQKQSDMANQLHDQAYRKYLGELEAQQTSVNENYDALAAMQYQNYRQGERSLPQTMAALGLAGQGVSETSAVGLLNQYQSGLSEGERARNQSLGELRLQQAGVGYQNEVDRLAALGQITRQQQASYETYLAAAQAQDNAARAYAENRAQNAFDNSLDLAGVTGTYGGEQTAQAKQQEFENAYVRLKTLGYVLPQDAATLGVPAGTKTADYFSLLQSLAAKAAR